MKIGPYELNQIYTGDARVLAETIPGNSVDLIFTDPPYPKEYLDLYGWLAETAARVLKPGGLCISLSGNLYFNQVMTSFNKYLDYYWLGGMPHFLGSTNQVHPRQMMSGWKPVLWYSKGKVNRHPYVFDFFQVPPDKKHHDWGQPARWAYYYLDNLSKAGDLIFEPFAGGGSVCLACRMLGRNYLAFEIDPATADKARERVFNTQPPLILPEPIQSVLFEENNQ